MGYQPRIKSHRASGRGYGKLQREKGKHVRRGHRSDDNSTMEETHVTTLKEVSDGTLRQIRNLGKQKFGSSPFSEHFDRWLIDLADVLSQFELNLNISTDDHFLNECSQILSNVKAALEERRRKEASLEEAVRNLSNSNNLLEQIRNEYTSNAREIYRRKNREIKRLQKNIVIIKEELNHTIQMKTGFFRGVSKKAREQKEIEITQELNSRQNELELAMLGFTEEQEKLRDKYEGKKQPVIDQIKDRRKKIESLGSDDSLEDRWFACEALIDAVNALLQRKALQPH